MNYSDMGCISAEDGRHSAAVWGCGFPAESTVFLMNWTAGQSMKRSCLMRLAPLQRPYSCRRYLGVCDAISPLYSTKPNFLSDS